MQRRNYAALFAALVIGFGAVNADAAEVLSVTIDAPADSGAVLAIGDGFTVTAIVEDYTAYDGDGVIIALVSGSGTDGALELVADGEATGGGKTTDPATAQVVAAPTVGNINTGRTGTDLAVQGGGAEFVGVRIQRQYGNTDSAHYIGGDGTSVRVDPKREQVTYVWNSKVHVSSTEAKEIRAIAVAVDQTASDGTPGVTAADEDTPNVAMSSDGVGHVQFDIDAERPVPPVGLVNVGTSGDMPTVLLSDDESGDLIRTQVAGIGDQLRFDIAVGPSNMRLLTRQNHTVVLGVKDHTGKVLKVYPVSMEGRRADTLAFRQSIGENDFGDLVGAQDAATPSHVQGLNAAPVARNSATAYIVDPNGNRSRDLADDGTPVAADWVSGDDPADKMGGPDADITHLLDAKKPVIDGVSGKDFVASGGDTLEIASPDSITDGTLNTGYSDDLNPIIYKLHEKLSALTIDIGGVPLKITNQEKDVAKWATNDAGEVIEADPAARDTVLTDSDDALNNGADDRVRVIFSVGDDAAHKVASIHTQNLGGTAEARDQSMVLRPAALPTGDLKTGVKTIKVTGTDYAGNTGPAAERADVYVDVDNLAFNGLFPREADVKIIEETSTSDVRFTLSEHADSVLISWIYISGPDRLRPDEAKTRALVGGELLTLEEQVFRNTEFINAARRDTGLVDNSKYQLTLLGADLAGNFSLTDAGQMTYDTNYVVPAINYFTVSSNPPGGTRTDGKNADGTDSGKCKLAGCGQVAAHKDPQFTLTVNAWNKKDVAALAYGKVNYNNDAVVTLSGGSGEGLTLSGKGVVTEGMAPGVARLTSDAWGVGRIGDVISWKADVKVNARKAPETHSVKVEDLTSDADSNFVGKLDSVLVIKHAGYKTIEVTVSDTVQLHSQFKVDLRYVDEWGNTVLESGHIEATTPILGLSLPQGALPITNGLASFWVRSDEHLGDVALTFREVETNRSVTKTVTVTERQVVSTDDGGDDDGQVADPGPDAPDKLVGEDYKGALGQGDQGGFVMLTFDLSDNHSTLDGGYRIWRDVTVTQGTDDEGNVVELSEPTIKPVAWGHVDAIPGVDVMRVVVATLDGDATFYGVTAESQGRASDAIRTGGGDDGMADDGMADDGMEDDGAEDDGTEDDGAEDDGTEDDGSGDDGTEDDGSEDGGEETTTDTTATDNKRAFTVTQSVSMPYELMAETMVRSREAAQGNLEGPVFATLTPEALAFHERGGLVPSLKSVQGELTDHITRTEEAVRAIDDIPPAPVTWVRALDTPGDAGASITIDWTRSIDDRIMTSVVPQAVGANGNVFTSAGVVGYNISRRIGDGAWQLLGEAPAGSSSWEDLTAANGVRYSYKVEPKDLEQITPSEIVKSAMAIRNTVVDGDGNRIVGLFGADNRVDYDDFFIFADHFGLTAESDLYEAAFDIIPNDVIDVDDFFAFAESFGKEVAGIGKAVPTKAGLNSEARFYIDNAAGELPRVGEEMSLLVSLEDFAEVRGYGFTVNFDDRYLEFVEPRFEDNPLGEAGLAQPRVIANADGEIHIAAFGETVSEGDLGVTLVFRSIEEIEESLVEVMAGGVQDGSYGLNRITDPVAIRVETRPEVYALENNFPNPFNPETTIKYQLPDANEVTLEVFNMLGQVVRTMVDREFQNAGRYSYQWDATNDSGQPLSSGIYFYRVTAGGEFQSHKKMLLLK